MSIKNFKPKKNSRHNEGYYRCKNPDKYHGDKNKIIYRSSYELAIYTEFDLDPKVLKWSAEPPQLMIRYTYRVTGRQHSYYPDVYVEKLTKDNTIEKYVIEIKPMAFLKKPKQPTSKDRRKNIAYKKRLAHWLKIMDKKIAAEAYCRKRGLKYIFLTETFINRKKS